MSDVEIVSVDSLDALDALSDYLVGDGHSGWVSFDLETRSDGGGKRNTEDWHDSSRIVSVSFSTDGDSAYVVPLSHPKAPWRSRWQVVMAELAGWLLDAPGISLFGHNVKYDVRWVASRCDVDLSPLIRWDTMAGSFLQDENQAHGLKPRAVTDLGVEPWDTVPLDDAEQVGWVDLSRYNGLDTAYCFRLHELQRVKLKEDPKLGKVMWYVLMPAIRALSQVERNGMMVDLAEVESRRKAAEAEHLELYRKLEAQVPAELAVKYGFQHEKLFDVGEPTSKEKLSLAPTSKFFKDYAVSRWPVLERKQSGSASWDASVMKRLAKAGHEDAKLLLDYRKLDKQITTYLSRWPVDAVDGRLYPTYKATTVVTGRLSCERPNLQQVDKKLKTCFVAPPGWRFVQADYSQIEVRIMAHVSGDENLRAVYRDGKDVYIETAAAVYGVAPEDVTPEQRQKAKPAVLGFLYGMLPPSFVSYARDVFGIEFTLEEAEHIRGAFFGLYPRVLEYHERQRRAVRRHKQVRSPFGRIRRLPEIDSPDQKQRWSAERQGINAPIQSGASELMLLALARVNRDLGHDVCRIVGTVHDSMLLEVRIGFVDRVLDEVGRIMVEPETELYGLRLTIPLAVEFEVGDRWGDPERTFETVGVVPQEVVAA